MVAAGTAAAERTLCTMCTYTLCAEVGLGSGHGCANAHRRPVYMSHCASLSGELPQRQPPKDCWLGRYRARSRRGYRRIGGLSPSGWNWFSWRLSPGDRMGADARLLRPSRRRRLVFVLRWFFCSVEMVESPQRVRFSSTAAPRRSLSLARRAAGASLPACAAKRATWPPPPCSPWLLGWPCPSGCAGGGLPACAAQRATRPQPTRPWLGVAGSRLRCFVALASLRSSACRLDYRRRAGQL